MTRNTASSFAPTINQSSINDHESTSRPEYRTQRTDCLFLCSGFVPARPTRVDGFDRAKSDRGADRCRTTECKTGPADQTTLGTDRQVLAGFCWPIPRRLPGRRVTAHRGRPRPQASSCRSGQHGPVKPRSIRPGRARSSSRVRPRHLPRWVGSNHRRPGRLRGHAWLSRPGRPRRNRAAPSRTRGR